jgi:hypothetical protein
MPDKLLEAVLDVIDGPVGLLLLAGLVLLGLAFLALWRKHTKDEARHAEAMERQEKRHQLQLREAEKARQALIDRLHDVQERRVADAKQAFPVFEQVIAITSALEQQARAARENPLMAQMEEVMLQLRSQDGQIARARR